MENIYLNGSEAVERAGYSITAAAEQMTRAASSMDHSLTQHQQFMEDWLSRFEAAVERISR